jgi:hypothetical protein
VLGKPHSGKGRRLKMIDQTALKKEISSAKSNLEMDLDEVIRSLEEAAQEIEKIDWEHGNPVADER